MDAKMMAACFNLWMTKFTQDPKAFEAEFETVGQFLRETQQEGGEGSYGLHCAAYMLQLASELGDRGVTGEGFAPPPRIDGAAPRE